MIQASKEKKRNEARVLSNFDNSVGKMLPLEIGQKASICPRGSGRGEVDSGYELLV